MLPVIQQSQTTLYQATYIKNLFNKEKNIVAIKSFINTSCLRLTLDLVENLNWIL